MSNAIPDGWSKQSLLEFCDRVTDGTHDTPKKQFDGVRLVTSKNLKNGKLVLDDSYFITRSDFEEIEKRSKVDVGDVIYGMIGTIGNPVLIESTATPFAIKNVALFKFSGDITRAKWLKYYLNSEEFLSSIDQSQTGNAQKFVGLGFLRSAEVPVPPLSEQQKITTILSSVDDVIEKTRAQIDKLKDLKTGMMQELLTKGVGHTEFKDSPVGFIPINWEVKQIGEMVVKVGSGITPRGGSASYVDVGIPLIRSQNVHSDGLRLDNVSYITKTQHAKMSGSQLKPCDVLLNITGASIGRCYYLPSDFKEGNVNQHVCIIRLKQKILDSVFLTFCLNSESGQRQIMSLQAGGNREGLNFQQVRAIRLPVPPLDEQKKIAEIVSSIEKNICNKLAKLAHMSDTKKALMQDLLTGKVRVTPNESAAL